MGSTMQPPADEPGFDGGKVVARDPIRPSASTSDDEIYKIVANEIDAGNISKGLWTGLYVQAEGDEIPAPLGNLHEVSKLARPSIVTAFCSP